MLRSTSQVWKILRRGRVIAASRLSGLKQAYERSGCDQERSGYDLQDVAGLLDWLLEHECITPYQASAICGEASRPLTVGPYVVFERLKRGRLQGIYRARHHRLRMTVCLRLLPEPTEQSTLAEKAAAARFRREARIAAQASHPHVMRTLHVSSADGYYFHAFEELPGRSLEDLLCSDSARDTALDSASHDLRSQLWSPLTGQPRPAEVCRLLYQVTTGLAQLHAQEIVHGGVCPANIWVTHEGHAKLIDFSHAQDVYGALDAEDFPDESARGDPAEREGQEGDLQLTDLRREEADPRVSSIPGNLAEDAELDFTTDLRDLGATLAMALAGRSRPLTAEWTPSGQPTGHQQNSRARGTADQIAGLSQLAWELASGARTDCWDSAEAVAQELARCASLTQAGCWVGQDAEERHDRRSGGKWQEFLLWASQRGSVFAEGLER